MIYVKRKEFFKTMDKKSTSKKENKKDKKSLIIIILLLLIIGLISYFGFFAKSDTDDTLTVDQTQSEYVKPEDPVDRSKNVSLPGWGSFTIPANTKKIDKGFEFHNPDTNFWYEDSIQYNGKCFRETKRYVKKLSVTFTKISCF